MANGSGLRVAFIHPDLGLGGAERLVVDAAAELVRFGHTVDMYTAFYDPNRCFEETKTGGFAVRTAGGWFPRHFGGRLMALCAYIRCVLVALHIAWRTLWSPRPDTAPYDVIIADQVAVVVPVVRALMPRSRVLFYCHFPDLLLTQRKSLLKRLYRAPLDYVEELSTGAAHLVLVNSNYTRGVFKETFRRLAARGMDPGVLYPAVAIPASQELAEAAASWRKDLDPDLVDFIAGGTTFLSINRFERKKGIGLAIEALHEVLVMRASGGPGAGGAGSAASSASASAASAGAGAAAGGPPPRLVVAGGYDPRLAENVEHLQELREAAAAMDLRHEVRFLPSFTDRQRTLLLAACRAVLYTPQHEHFGIVPLEAMAAARPVVAVNSGGPTESVVSGVTGFLCDPTPAAFAGAMAALMGGSSAGGKAGGKEGASSAEEMGAAARAHVEAKFSRRAFGDALDGYVRGLVVVAGKGKQSSKKAGAEESTKEGAASKKKVELR
ncbi:hypothetical protein HYH02_008005 [Chlamydomonas schloesseri]|uniref:Alpha-1,3/1,6-mannosyltransferase ALG2 n=1 Tax=Chlamydomonas schloesseri TaxID=2026947 RepID=A0A835WG39_9CHLO|nr:hypothetical protein HYH02_008005 [Chlamydomonas schloesseri]|eukprot:KAG2446848.1 hypothetical protein HYH02_008005 [Chlamydomonas schloesseri]